ncbi:MAG: thiamine ABC transporter substrate-binding protein [Micrococcales bacterium]|nr:thiamine ABC transporter substrate-binding protein [Micrococcales bacterium]
MVRISRPRVLAAALGLGLALGVAGCSAVGTGSDDPSAAGTVTLVTHDSFGVPDDVLAQFTAQTGLKVQVVTLGDTGSLVNRLVLTKGAPLGDAVFGIDNTFATRALDEGVIAPVEGLSAPALADAKAHALPGDDGRLVAVDYGDVCVNVDTTWFAARDLTPPVTLDDLTRPEYRGLFVTPNPATSSPGFAFLLATVGAKGDGWQQYWKDLDANDVQIAADWSDAYTSAFTAGGGNGDRPVVLSYDTSPPFTVPDGSTEPTTAALLGTCFRQTEYAGVLTGAKNPDGAAALVDFLLSDAVQQDIPQTMYMYPVSTSVTLPPAWVAWAPLATDPFTVDPADITAHREQWLTQWTDLDIG